MIDAPRTAEFFERANRQSMAGLLNDIVLDAPSIARTLDLGKDDTPIAALALLLSAASADAHRVFVAALRDVLDATVAVFVASEGLSETARMLRALDLVEIALVESVETDDPELLRILTDLTTDEREFVTPAVARLLSYFDSLAAITTLTTIFSRAPHDPTIAAYLLGARARFDPLSAFEFDCSHIPKDCLPSSPELRLSIQSAIWAMFNENPRLAKERIRYQASVWSPDFSALTIDILTNDPLRTIPAAHALAQTLSPSGEVGSGYSCNPTGIAKRVIERGSLKCIDGYSLHAARGPGDFKSYRGLWMIELAKVIIKRLKILYKCNNDLTVNFSTWPAENELKAQDWTSVFECLKSKLVTVDKDRLIDICFEMVYIDRHRMPYYEVVYFGELNSFSAVYDRSALQIDDALKSTAPNAEAFLGALSDIGNPGDHCVVWTYMSSVSGDFVRDLFSSRVQSPTERREADISLQLIDAIKQNPTRVVVLCDNVARNSLINTATHHGKVLNYKTLNYIDAIPVGLAFDTLDSDWGHILEEAFLSVLSNPSQPLRASLKQHFDDLVAIGVQPSRSLLMALKAPDLDSVENKFNL